jgi:hypothetical protein
VADSCEHGNETSISMKGGESFDWLNDYEIIFTRKRSMKSLFSIKYNFVPRVIA